MKNLKNEFKYLKQKFEYLNIFFSPFICPKIKIRYFNEIKQGTPYFLPRKIVKFTKQDSINKYLEEVKRFNDKGFPIPETLNENSYLNYTTYKPIKYFGINTWGLGWKTKWSNVDVRFEWSPGISLVLFGKQICFYFKFEDNSLREDIFWEAWIIYNYRTNKNKSKEERLLELFKMYKCTWSKSKSGIEITTDYYLHILKPKYLDLYKNYLQNEKINK